MVTRQALVPAVVVVVAAAAAVSLPQSEGWLHAERTISMRFDPQTS